MRLPHTITRSVHAQRVLEKCTCAQPLMLFAGMERFRRAVGCVVTCSRRIQCHPPNPPRRSQSTAPAQTRFPTTFAPTNDIHQPTNDILPTDFAHKNLPSPRKSCLLTKTCTPNLLFFLIIVWAKCGQNDCGQNCVGKNVLTFNNERAVLF